MQATQPKIEYGKYAGKPIDSRLQVLLNEVHHFNPLFTFIAKDTTGYGDEARIDELTVIQGNQVVGVIAVSHRYRRNESDSVFVARSENIKRERNISVSSKHLKVVMKEIKEAFKPRTDEKRIEEITSTILTKLIRMRRNASSHVQGAVSNAAIEVMMLLQRFAEDPKPTELPVELVQKLGRNWETYLDGARISEAVSAAYSAKRGVCVRIEMDGKLAVVDLVTDTLTEHDSTYDLATNYQEKITMLKLMDEDQPIEHVGVRFSDWESINGVRMDSDYFFLVSGETFTNC
jgi:hypothetical protein